MSETKLKVGLLDKSDTEQALKALKISPTWEKEHKLCFLEINGRTPALDGLLKIAKDDKQAYKKLLKTIKEQLASKDLLRDPKKARPGQKAHQKDVFELKGKFGRLLGFFSESGELIICTNTYWKTKSSKKEQNESFDKAARLKAVYNQYSK